jgi:hypothetical protein
MRHQISKTMTFFNGLIRMVKSVLTTTVLVLMSVFAVSNQVAAEDATFTVTAPGATSARITGPWWGWGATGPAAEDNGDGTFSVTWNPGDDGTVFEYLWIVDDVQENFIDNIATGTDENSQEYTYIESLVCAPITDGVTYANRVWLTGDGDRSDVYEDCSSPTPTALPLTLTVEATGTEVRLTGPWWNWAADGGPIAADNGDGTWSVAFDAPVTASLEYLWVVDGVEEDLRDNAANGECYLDGLNVGGSAEGGDHYAIRTWSYGSGDVTGDVYDACLGTGGGYPTPPAPTDAEGDVISVISTSYNDLEGVNFNPGWGQATTVVVGEDGVLTYSGLNYQGTEYASQDVTGYQYLNVDFYTEDSTALNMFVIKSGGNEVGFGLTDSIELNQWVNVQVPLSHFDGTVDLTAVDQFKVDGNGTVYLTNLYFGGVYDENADADNDGVANSDDPLPNNPDFSDITQAAFSDAFGGTTIGDGFVYTYPSTGTEVWAGFANKNNSLYPITFGDNAVVNFTGSVPSGGSVDLEFRFENQPHPYNTVTYTSSVVTVAGASASNYQVAVTANATEFNTFLMYLLTQDEGVVIQDVSFDNSAPKQEVSLVGEPKGIIGEQLTVTVDYNTSTDSNVTGLGLNVHYDSSVLTPVSISDVLQYKLFMTPSVDYLYSDSENGDDVFATDMFMKYSWVDFTGSSWPGNLPENLLTITFDVVDDNSLENTVIGFSTNSTAAGYMLNAPAVNIELMNGSWDFDGNGYVDALTDGLLFIRYGFNLRGTSLIQGAVAQNSLLSSNQIEENLQNAMSSLDIDGDQTINPLSDGLILLRYLFGFDDESLIDGVVHPNGSRQTLDEIKDYMNGYIPAN